MTNNASANNSFAATVLSQLEIDFERYISAFADWAEIASQMETRNGQNKVTARTEYELNNECSNIWAALYGNTTDTRFPFDPAQKLDQRTQFCARMNLAYQEHKLQSYYDKNPTVDPTAPEFNEMDAAADMTLLNYLVEEEEARRNYARLHAKFTMLKNLYEIVTGAEFVYKPYTVTERSNNQPANAKIGLTLLKRAAA